jgi:ATP-dependent Clp protease protease subunit
VKQLDLIVGICARIIYAFKLNCLLLIVPLSLFVAAKLYLPKVNRSSGAVIDMWIKVLALFSLSLSLSLSASLTSFFQAKELDANTEYYIELLEKGIGKPKEEIAKDIQRPKYFQALEAIDYGIADKIIDSRDSAFEKRVMFPLFFVSVFL